MYSESETRLAVAPSKFEARRPLSPPFCLPLFTFRADSSPETKLRSPLRLSTLPLTASVPDRMFSGLLARPTLTIELQEDQVFVQPHFFHPDSPGLAKDPILNGTVNLTLPAPRAVSKLKVVLEGVQIVGGDKLQYESSVILHKDLEIKVDETLPAGSHV